jgi:predicted methyltransferase
MRCLSVALLMMALTGPAVAADSSAEALTAVGDATRPAKDREADAIRKPAETLTFSGVKSAMEIGEFYPGSGYFTRMLSDLVGPEGHIYAIENKAWQGPQPLDKVLGKANVSLEALPFGTVQFPKPLDLVWITQNYHDLKIAEYGKVDTAVFNEAVYAALKPGGTYLILDHEAPAGTSVAAIARLHRIERAQVIREVTAAGFRLVAEGSFLRRSDDDHSLSIFDKKVQGKTDQYALKFVKPAA